MKNIAIILCLVLLVSGIVYTKLFIGSESYSSSAKHALYNTHFHTLNLPLTTFKKGFFSYTFYVKNPTDTNAAPLSFEVDYRTKTITFNHVEEWNSVIESLHITNANLLKNEYNYFELDHSFFNDMKPHFVSYRLLEDSLDRQLIIHKSDAVVRIGL